MFQGLSLFFEDVIPSLSHSRGVLRDIIWTTFSVNHFFGLMALYQKMLRLWRWHQKVVSFKIFFVEKMWNNLFKMAETNCATFKLDEKRLREHLSPKKYFAQNLRLLIYNKNTFFKKLFAKIQTMDIYIIELKNDQSLPTGLPVASLKSWSIFGNLQIISLLIYHSNYWGDFGTASLSDFIDVFVQT